MNWRFLITMIFFSPILFSYKYQSLKRAILDQITCKLTVYQQNQMRSEYLMLLCSYFSKIIIIIYNRIARCFSMYIKILQFFFLKKCLLFSVMMVDILLEGQIKRAKERMWRRKYFVLSQSAILAKYSAVDMEQNSQNVCPLLRTIYWGQSLWQSTAPSLEDPFLLFFFTSFPLPSLSALPTSIEKVVLKLQHIKSTVIVWLFLTLWGNMWLQNAT